MNGLKVDKKLNSLNKSTVKTFFSMDSLNKEKNLTIFNSFFLTFRLINTYLNIDKKIVILI